MRFVIFSDNETSGEVFETLEEAMVEAKSKVSDTPDTEVEVAQVLKLVSSTLTVDIKDV